MAPKVSEEAKKEAAVGFDENDRGEGVRQGVHVDEDCHYLGMCHGGRQASAYAGFWILPVMVL